MSAKLNVPSVLRGLAGAVALATSLSAHPAATIVIENFNAAGVGFNDATPVAPVGGNAGTTLGQQRLNAFQAAANIWGATLTSTVTIVVRSSFEPLTCTANSAVLGSAGATTAHANFTGALLQNTWYPGALANTLFGADLDPTTPEIRARFNVNLGQTGCLDGRPFYLGLDNNHGALIDLVTVLLHEFGHGLGFQNFTSGTSGTFLGPPFLPAVWDHFMFDNTTGKYWIQMTNAERQASALNVRKVVWTGANVTTNVPGVLAAGTPRLLVTSVAVPAVNGEYPVGTAAFGPPPSSPGVTGQVMPVSTLGCAPFPPLDALAAKNNIVLINRGTCSFRTKTKNAQDALARGVILANNVAGSPPPGLGDDPTVPGPITIPTVSIALADADTLRNALAFRSRTASGVVANIGINPAQFAGADTAGRVLLFTPNPFQGGSSVSHWDTIAFPNLLMEPAINGDLLHSVVPPADLTFPLLHDMGW